MKLSLNWLNDYIPIDLSIGELVSILTEIGLEVSNVEHYESIKGGLKDLIIGEVKTCIKHPNADNLSVTKVNVGNKDLLSIVCGAPNVAKGQKVVVAIVGSTLYKGNESLTIRKTKIRGEISEGMICSEGEIGLGDNHSSILVLPETVTAGIPASTYFNVEKDTVIELDLTPNRVDAASHIGVARDLAAYLQQHKKISYQKPSIKNFAIDKKTDPIKISLISTEACPRYSGICLKNIKIDPSPRWLQNRLKAIDIKPINNIVDITNYVLFETGQPLHAFDRAKIEGDIVVVKTLPQNTQFTTLDEVERSLHKNDLMICDINSPLCIGGVFGGIHSGVSQTTTSIFLESAYFDPIHIHNTARRHHLSTDASYRFERGTDIKNTIYALKRAALLMKELCGATVSSEIIDIYPQPFIPKIVHFKYTHLNRLVGQHIEKKQVQNILTALEIKILTESKNTLQLEIPFYRVDVTREVDVIEEVLRIYGYNNISFKNKINASLSYTEKPDKHQSQNKIANYLSSHGFSEIVNNSLTKSSYYESFTHIDKNKIVRLSNPLSSDLNVMRQSLLFGGLEVIAYNKNRQHTDLKIYEFGNIYRLKNNQQKQTVNADSFVEEKQLSLFICGNEYTQNWQKSETTVDFFLLKFFVNNILLKLGLQSEDIKIDYTKHPFFLEGLSYSVQNKKWVDMGLLDSKVLKKTDLNIPVFYAEMKWDNIVKKTNEQHIVFNPLSKFPFVKRDLALLIDKNIQYRDIEKLAFKTLSKTLQSVKLFDVYEGRNIEKGKKSYALSFILQDENKTLNDRQIENMVNKLIVVFKKEFNAIIR